MSIRTVFIESPYSGDIPANTAYARKCVMDSLKRGEAPVALHLLYTALPDGEFVSDSTPVEGMPGREKCLERCRAVRNKQDLVVFYIDKGWSHGMKQALDEVIVDVRPYIFRCLDLHNIKEDDLDTIKEAGN
jgi:hypothetical protein